MKKTEIFLAGIFKENPSLVVFLGMCPSLVASKTMDMAIGMGMAVIIVLLITNSLIASIRNVVPNEVRIPVYIVIVASIVKSIQMLMEAFTPSVYASLGIFIPLIVVNCIILGRAEAFASKNTVVNSFMDGLGQSFGFTASMILVAFFREVLGTGALQITNPFDSAVVFFNFRFFPSDFAITILQQPIGAFLAFGLIAAIINVIRAKLAEPKPAKAPAASPAPAKG